MLSGLVDWAAGALSTGGLPALFLVLVAENLFPPIPSEAVLPLAGYLVSQGRFAFLAAWAVSTAGALVGAWILYALGRYGGRPLIYRFSWLLRMDERQLDRADAWFDARGGVVVLVGRVVPLFRSIVSVPAGMSEMPFWRFTLLTLLGTGAWNAALIGGGMALGPRYDRLADTVDALTWPLLAVGVVAFSLYVALTWRRRRSSAASARADVG